LSLSQRQNIKLCDQLALHSLVADFDFLLVRLLLSALLQSIRSFHLQQKKLHNLDENLQVTITFPAKLPIASSTSTVKVFCAIYWG
jgi:hypothetical protein